MHLNGDTVASVPTNKVNPKTGMSQMGKGKDTAGTCHQDHASIYTTEQHRHQSQHPIQPLHQHGVEKQSIHNTIHTSSVEGGGGIQPSPQTSMAARCWLDIKDPYAPSLLHATLRSASTMGWVQVADRCQGPKTKQEEPFIKLAQVEYRCKWLTAWAEYRFSWNPWWLLVFVKFASFFYFPTTTEKNHVSFGPAELHIHNSSCTEFNYS